MWGSRDPLLEFWEFLNFVILGPPDISGMNEARNFKFGTEMDSSEQ